MLRGKGALAQLMLDMAPLVLPTAALSCQLPPHPAQLIPGTVQVRALQSTEMEAALGGIARLLDLRGGVEEELLPFLAAQARIRTVLSHTMY